MKNGGMRNGKTVENWNIDAWCGTVNNKVRKRLELKRSLSERKISGFGDPLIANH